jgi:hypothetical protein
MHVVRGVQRAGSRGAVAAALTLVVAIMPDSDCSHMMIIMIVHRPDAAASAVITFTQALRPTQWLVVT